MTRLRAVKRAPPGVRRALAQARIQSYAGAGVLIVVPLILSATANHEPRVNVSLSAQQESKLKDSGFITEGAKLFMPNCSSAYCHGSDGMGGGAPKLRDKGLDAPYLFKTISNGISGTPMRPFKSEMSEEKIWQLAAYIMSPPKSGDMNALPPTATGQDPASKPGAGLGSAVPKPASSTAAGDPVAGKSLFFDNAQQKSCQSCHSFQGVGASIGPDLSKLEASSARDLFLAIVIPGNAHDQRYRTSTITLKSGEKIIGIKKEEDTDS